MEQLKEGQNNHPVRKTYPFFLAATILVIFDQVTKIYFKGFTYSDGFMKVLFTVNLIL